MPWDFSQAPPRPETHLTKVNPPMNHAKSAADSRREFLKNSGKAVAVTALAGMAVPHVHAAEDNTIQIVLIGCGGRGTGAAANALSVKNGPIKLVAMADVFKDRLARQLSVR